MIFCGMHDGVFPIGKKGYFIGKEESRSSPVLQKNGESSPLNLSRTCGDNENQ